MMIQRLLWPLTRLGDMFDAYERANVSAGRLQGLLDQSPNIISPKQPITSISTQPGIEFDHVHFSYNNATNVLNGVNFTIPHGQTVGLAGFTGAGKSTIIKCLLRFYDPTNGASKD